MEMIPAVLYYNGTWSDGNQYHNFEVTGLLIPTTCQLKELQNLVCSALRIDSNPTKLSIKFQIRSSIPPINISDESTFRFFMEVSRKSDEHGKYPLIIENAYNSGVTTSFQNMRNVEGNNIQFVTPIRVRQWNSEIVPLATREEQMRTQYADQLAIEATDQQSDILQDRAYKEEQWDDVISDPNEYEVRVHQTYRDKKILAQAIRLHSIRQNRQHKVERTSGKDFVLVCIENEKCKWKLRASKFRQTSMFKVREFNDIHTCSTDILLGDHRQANSELVSECILHKLTNVKTNYTPTDIVEDMMTEYNVSISYQKAWRAKEKALKKVRGNPHDYSMIPSWLHMIKQTNPGNHWKIFVTLILNIGN